MQCCTLESGLHSRVNCKNFWLCCNVRCVCMYVFISFHFISFCEPSEKKNCWSFVMFISTMPVFFLFCFFSDQGSKSIDFMWLYDLPALSPGITLCSVVVGSVTVSCFQTALRICWPGSTQLRVTSCECVSVEQALHRLVSQIQLQLWHLHIFPVREKHYFPASGKSCFSLLVSNTFTSPNGHAIIAHIKSHNKAL